MRFVLKGLLPFLLLAFGSVFSLTRSSAQPVTTQGAAPSPAEIERIIQAFTTKETQFRKALVAYAFKRDALIQEVGMGGQVVGEYHRVSHFTFDDAGNKFEKIDYFPLASFEGVTQEDVEDLGGINPYALDSSKAGLYDFKYVGKERIDELDLHVFDVSPKVMPDPKKIKDRLFLGRVWVDDKDLQIVKSRGKGVPDTKKNKFPNVETYREQIDGKYWFPTYSYADDELVFDAGNVLHIRLRVKYSDYEQARGKLRIIEMDGERIDLEAKPKPSPSPKGSKPQEN